MEKKSRLYITIEKKTSFARYKKDSNRIQEIKYGYIQKGMEYNK